MDFSILLSNLPAQRSNKVQNSRNRGSLDLSYPPLRLRVEPTNLCNLKCTSCPNGVESPREGGFMDMGLFRKIIDEASTFPPPTEVILYLGGEPMLHANLVNMIEYAAERNLFVRFNSNAALLTPELTDMLLSTELFEIAFSFDDMPPAQYEALRRNSSYEKTLANIIAFLERREEKRSKFPRVRIAPLKYFDPARDLASQQRYSDEFLQLFAKSFVEVQGSFLHSWGGGFEIMGGRLTREHQGKSDYEKVRVKRLPKCENPWKDCVINYKGDVVACCYDLQYKHIVGNICSHRIMDVWNGKKMQELRRLLVKKQYDKLPLCVNCAVVKGEGMLDLPLARFIKSI